MTRPRSRPLILVGYSIAWLQSMDKRLAEGPVLVVEEPDVARKRDASTRLAAVGLSDRLIGWEYQLPGAAERFFGEQAELRPAAVLPCVEYAVPFAARLAALYGVPGAGLRAAAVLRDKALLRWVTSQAGVTNPRSQQADSPDAVRKFMLACGGPVVLKPANRQASVGTRVMYDPTEAEAGWQDCLVQDEGVNVPDRLIPLRMLVEQYVRGEEFSVEMLVRNGVALFANVTQKRLFPGPRPVEMGHAVPAEIPERLRALLVAETGRVLDAARFRSGVVHCEWILSEGIPFLVECAGRLPGDGIVDLIDYAWDMDLVSLFVAVMRGADPARMVPRAPIAGAAVWFLRAEPGEVLSIAGVDEIRRSPGVLGAEVLVKPGDRTRELRSSWDRVGYVRVGAASAGQALRLAEQAAARVRIEMDPTAGRLPIRSLRPA